MLGAKPTVFVSHSEKFKEDIALPFRVHAESLGMNVILVSEMPTPEHGAAEPDAKVDYYLDRADMFVALMTPDDRTDSGEIHARPNVTDEITRARMRSHLRPRVQVFKASDVDLHSNINPTYEALDLSDVCSIFPVFERQARAWEILAPDRPEDPQSAVGPIGPSDPALEGSTRASQGALGQAVEAIDGLKAILIDPSFSGGSGSPAPVARAHLSASVALAAARSTSPFGVHELNGLYRERELLDLTGEEERFLLRTVLLYSTNENAPGWYWLRRWSAVSLYEFVLGLALGDPDASVRSQSLKILAGAPRKIRRRELRALMEAGVGRDEEQSVRVAGLDLLAKRGDTRLLKELGDVLDTPGGPEATLVVRAKHAPVAALRELLKRPSMHSSEVEGALLGNARKLPVTLLRQGLRSDYPVIRRLSVRALDRSSRFRKEDALTLITGELPAVERMEALKVALRRGWVLDNSVLDAAIKDAEFPFGEVDELRIEFYSKRSREELLKDLTWIGDRSWTVYAALGLEHFNDFADRLRDDLDSDFKSLRDEYRRNIEAVIQGGVEEKIHQLALADQPDPAVVKALVSERMDDFFKDFDSLESFTIRRFRIAALRALVAHGQGKDAAYARRFIGAGDRDVTNECVRLLARVGTGEDVGVLIEAAENLYADDSVRAAGAALAVSENVIDAVAALIDTGASGLIKVAVAALKDVPLEEATRIVLPMLNSKDEGVRRAGIDLLSRRLDRVQARNLIDFYIERSGYYYYNVILRLDRLLYAPAWIRGASESA
jgi:hypothetical protein